MKYTSKVWLKYADTTSVIIIGLRVWAVEQCTDDRQTQSHHSTNNFTDSQEVKTDISAKNLGSIFGTIT